MRFGLGAYSLRYSSLDESDFRKMSIHIQKLPVVSMGRRNTGSQSTCWSLKPQSLSGALI
jgi:hypothetical protein